MANGTHSILNVIELVLNFVALVFNGYFLILLWRPFFHVNLRIMLGSFSLALVSVMLTRTTIIVGGFFVSFDSLNMGRALGTSVLITALIQFSGSVIVMSASIWMAIERFLATILAKKYEKNRLSGALLTVLLCAVVWVLSIFFTYTLIDDSQCKGALRLRLNAFTFEFQKNTGINMTFDEAFREFKKLEPELYKCLPRNGLKDNRYMTIVFIVILVFNFIGLSMFILIRKYNKNRWKMDLQKNLSHRYQIMENLRTSKQLLKVLVADFLISCYYFGFFYYSFNLTIQSTVFLIFTGIFNWVNSFASILFPVLFIVTHPKMFAKLKQDLRFRRRRKVKSARDVVVRRKATVEEAQKEANVYFTQLQSSWN
ncbi:hypothetical protein L596_013984 [Steinernema carpocapsae]|uniref:G-protein coupled receptors family 1 profile domain-containing protein n=1 Tax=Steinernema carpocapsae TaxID=34508 RepID=A0A4U5NBA3_STECR|nr:hypothetical protein L596_013984 [Steinernema carpocapsae]